MSPDKDEAAAELERAADVVRGRVEETLLLALERDLLGPNAMAAPRFTRVDTVVQDLLNPEDMERADEGLSSFANLDDERRFQAFAEQITQLSAAADNP